MWREVVVCRSSIRPATSSFWIAPTGSHLLDCMHPPVVMAVFRLVSGSLTTRSLSFSCDAMTLVNGGPFLLCMSRIYGSAYALSLLLGMHISCSRCNAMPPWSRRGFLLDLNHILKLAVGGGGMGVKCKELAIEACLAWSLFSNSIRV